MPQILKPRATKDVEDAIQWALGEGVAMSVVGHGSKAMIGRPVEAEITLDLSGLSGITLYEPNELVLSAKAGTPLSEIHAALTRENQELAFEPPEYAFALGGGASGGTIGGLIAANLSGPRRIKAGAARDHFLGVNAVSGRGEIFKSGGRVIKNVTGYDLCKLLAGSFGTLAVMTDMTFKVLPRAETERTLILSGLDDAKAASAMAAAMASVSDVSSAAHVPARVARHVTATGGGNAAITALRLEGVAASMDHRAKLLQSTLISFATGSLLPEPESRAVWQTVRDLTPLSRKEGEDCPLWRLSTAPLNGHRAAAQIAARIDADVMYDWAGGLVWVALPPSDDASAALVRAALRGLGGHATLMRAPASVRAAVDAFEPQDAATAALTKQVKAGFDPKGVLNPGRMYAGV